MRRLLPVYFLLMLAPAANLLAQGAPKAVPVEPVKNFEIIARGEVIEHTFEIKNDGDTPLEITNVRPACGCTVVEYDKTIAPGKIGRLAAKVDTTDFHGPISKSIAVFTSDVDNPKLQLVVRATVKPYIGALPGYVRYIYVQGEDLRPIGQTLWAEDGEEFKVTNVTKPYDYVDVSFREANESERNPDAPGKQWRVEVLLHKDAPVGALREYVQIQLDHPKQKAVKIPISGFVRPRQHVTPQEVDFGKLETASLPLRRKLHFTNFITAPIEVAEVETGYNGMTAEITPSEKQPGHRFNVMLTLGPDMPKGPFDTVVRIRTNDSKNPVVELPVKGVVN
ncbi:MAG: DUF1573 domain-containing protein [Acidobacteriota bacterium]